MFSANEKHNFSFSSRSALPRTWIDCDPKVIFGRTLKSRIFIHLGREIEIGQLIMKISEAFAVNRWHQRSEALTGISFPAIQLWQRLNNA